MMKKSPLFLFVPFLLFSTAQLGSAQEVGRKAAEKYFQEDARKSPSAIGDNLLLLHLGRYVNSQAYDWGATAEVGDVGAANYGVTYLFDEWHGLDLNIRMDFSEYNVQSNRALKLALLPLWTFPRADTRFPLYFGLGGGVGIFLQQLNNKSNLSFDYQLVMGARFMDLTPGFGAFIEFGLKNHLHILTNGQFNGTAFSAGAVFTF
jgi:hypothetical protein